MRKESPSNIGRIFYGLAMAGLGVQTVYYHDFPYMIIPPNHFWIPCLAIIAYIFGAFFILAGACIAIERRTGPIAFLLASVLLMIFCFYFMPYEFMDTTKSLQLGEWDNAEKELALSSGAFIIAGSVSKQNNFRSSFLRKLIPFGVILFALIITTFGIDHFLYANDVADYIPKWIPNRLVWAYFAGAGLLGSGVAIILKVKPQLSATLLGTMIFIWVIILHIPKAIASPFANMGSEVTSGLIALAYSGIAFVIAGVERNNGIA